MSIAGILAALVRRWRILLGIPLLVAFTTAIAVLIMKPSYTAETSFTAAGTSSASMSSLAGLASLAGQLGISAGSFQSSSDFLAAAIQSREIKRQALLSRFPDPRGESADSLLLMDILKIEGESERERLHNGLLDLDDRVSVAVGRRSGIVTVTVRTQWPDLSASLANRLVQLLNQFNLERQQYLSSEQSRFTGEQLRHAERALLSAERNLQNFFEANRNFANSPLLTFERDRLQRRVQLQQDVYVTLAREFEQSRIAASRDTPMLAVVDTARAPYWRTKPRRKVAVVMASAIGFMLAVAVALVLDQIGRNRGAAAGEWRTLGEAATTSWAEFKGLARRPPRDG